MQTVESRHPPGVVCVLSGEQFRYSISAQSLINLKTPKDSTLYWSIGVLIAKGINDAFRATLDNPRMQWMWIMGDDHTYRPDVVLRLLEHDKDVIAPVCLVRLPPMDPTIVEHDHQPKGRLKYLEDLPVGPGLYKLRKEETCGDAGLLIRRNVIESLAPENRDGEEWYDNKRSGAFSADDQAFVAKVMSTGFDVHVDLGTVIGHIANVVVVPVPVDGHWEIALGSGGKQLGRLPTESRPKEGLYQVP